MPPRNPSTKRPIVLALDYADTKLITRYQRNGDGHVVALNVANGAERDCDLGTPEGRDLLEHFRKNGNVDTTDNVVKAMA